MARPPPPQPFPLSERQTVAFRPSSSRPLKAAAVAVAETTTTPRFNVDGIDCGKISSSQGEQRAAAIAQPGQMMMMLLLDEWCAVMS